MQTVSEAKYTYWKSIIDIAAESGLSKEEFCSKYKIAIKTFNHYEGVFQRQRERGYIYQKQEKDEEAIPLSNKGRVSEGKRRKSLGAEYVEIPLDDGNVESTQKKREGSGRDMSDGCIKRVRVNDPEPVKRSQTKRKAGAEEIDRDGKPLAIPRDKIILNIGDCQLTIGEDIPVPTLLAILKAVGTDA